MKRLKSRLVGAFLIVVLLPVIPLSVVMWSLLGISFDSRQGEKIGLGLKSGMEESREALRLAKEEFERDVKEVWMPWFLEQEGAPFIAFTELADDGTMFSYISLLSSRAPSGNPHQTELYSWFSSTHQSEGDPNSWIGPERVGSHLAMGRYWEGEGDAGTLIFARPLDPAMVSRAEALSSAISYSEAFRVERRAVIRSYALPFVLIYLFLLAVAVGAGTVLAGRLSAPLESLAGSARRVGEGDLGTRVTVRSGGEIGELEESFNTMVCELESQRGELGRLERLAAWREMARSLAHEIKNPLTPIRLAVQEISDRYPGGDDHFAATLKECVEIVDEEVQALRNLVREFSEFARLPEPNPEQGDLSVIADEMLRLYGDDRVALSGSPPEQTAWFDHDQIRRAVINLVDNGLAACRMADRSERVTLSLAALSTGVSLSVSDRGCGIAEAELNRIFEPHYSRKTDGMGLGLPIVEGIIRSHGGSLNVKSRLGEGTTFTIILPAAPSHPEES